MTAEVADPTRCTALKVRLAALSVGQIVSWGVLYYGLIVAGSHLAREAGWALALVNGLFSISLIVSAVSGIAVGRLIDARGPRLVPPGSRSSPSLRTRPCSRPGDW